MSRSSILQSIIDKILSGGRRTTAQNTRDVLNEMANSYTISIYDTAANFTANNPVLETKTIGVETDNLTTTPKFKIGNGITAWNSLPYASSGGGGSQSLQDVITIGNTLTSGELVKSPDGNSNISVENDSVALNSNNSTDYSQVVVGSTAVTSQVNATSQTITDGSIDFVTTSLTKNTVEIATLTDLATKENSSNKSTSTADSGSSTKFPVWSAIVSYFSASQIRSILGITTLSGSNTGDNAVNSLYSGLVSNATHTGDATGATTLTLATVNSNVGTFGSASKTITTTVNGKGLTTAISEQNILISESQVTNLVSDLASLQSQINSINPVGSKIFMYKNFK